MFTLKQLEAIYWVATLGGFEAASSYLNLAQSTVSKRVGELERHFPEPLFDRSGRQAVLTAKGEDVRDLAQQFLRLNDQLVAAAKKASAPPIRFRLGTTDLVALSWLPQLITTVLRRYPDIDIEPEIDVTSVLFERLNERKIDFAICPRVFQHPQFVSVPTGDVELAWMASPDLLCPDSPVPTEKLLKYPLLTQSPKSIMWPVLQSVIDNPKLPFARKTSCNSIEALAEMAAAGLGIVILPRAFFGRKISEGRLRVFETEIPLPRLTYHINYRSDYHAGFYSEVADLCQMVANFSGTHEQLLFVQPVDAGLR